jgi:hypothetical protein
MSMMKPTLTKTPLTPAATYARSKVRNIYHRTRRPLPHGSPACHCGLPRAKGDRSLNGTYTPQMVT